MRSSLPNRCKLSLSSSTIVTKYIFCLLCIISFSLNAQTKEFVVFNRVMKSTAISSARLQSVTQVSGTSFKFISKNASFDLSKISNDVEGTLEYYDSGTKISITGIIQGKFVNGSTNTGLYFRSYSLTPETYFALAIPGKESDSDYRAGANPQYNSSGPDAVLATLKTTQTQAGSIVASISDPSSVSENGGTTVTFILSFNLDRTGSETTLFTPTLVAGTASSGSDYSSTFQYSTDNINFTNVSGAITVSATTNTLYLRASILDDSSPESSETFSLYTNSFSGTGASQLANSTGVVGMATILDDGDPYVWNGSTSNDWTVSSNWTPNNSGRPNSGDNAKIPSGTTNSPLLPGNASINNIEVASGATLSLSSYNLTVNGNLTNNGNISGAGNDGKIILNSNSAANVISGTGSIDNIELNNSSGANISSGSLSINNGFYPVNGILTTNGRLVLKSNSFKTATVFQKSGSCTSYISGDVTVERYIDPLSNSTFRFFGHPFAANKALSTFTNLPVSNAYRYNSTFATPNPNAANGDPAWVKLTSTDSWNQNTGIISLINNASAFTIDATGPLNQCSVTIPLSSVSNNDANLGWVLIANPFAAFLDLSYKSTLSDVGVQNGYYVWDVATNTNDAGSQKTRQSNFNHKGKYMTIISGVRSAGSAQRIAPYGGFFVQMTPGTGTVTGSITISESDKTNNKGTEYTPFSLEPILTSNRTIEEDLVSVNTLSIINQNTKIDDFKLIFRKGGNQEFDRFDLSKMHNSNLNIFTKLPKVNTDIAVDTRALDFSDFKLPIFLESNLKIEKEEFELKWDVENGVEADFYLYDLVNNDRIKLKNKQSYQFTAGVYKQDSPRFMIEVYRTSGENNNDQLIVSPNPSSDRIYINLIKPANTLKASILDLNGIQVAEYLIKTQTMHEPSINIENLKEGTYLLKITTDLNEIFTKKIYKK